MNPVWIDYNEWECYKGNMYLNGKDNEMVLLSYKLLTSDKCYDAMQRVTKEWQNSTLVNFTNKMFNAVSWLGQAACCLNHGAKSSETIEAWLSMNIVQQTMANNAAKRVIEEWENEGIYG